MLQLFESCQKVEMKFSKLVTTARFCGSIVPAFILGVQLSDYMVDRGGESARTWLGEAKKRYGLNCYLKCNLAL